MGTIIAAIIAGAVMIGTTVAGAKAQKDLTEDANQKSLRMWEQQRADEKKIREEKASLARWDKRFGQQQFSFQKEEAKKNRAERKEASDYQKRQQQFATSLGILNSNQQAKNTFFNIWNRRAGK
ncbi:MAG: hypothetical protein GY853_13885 [PVC group bacterium]|nr:hypothetical protein [PVC group bacterium]